MEPVWAGSLSSTVRTMTPQPQPLHQDPWSDPRLCGPMQSPVSQIAESSLDRIGGPWAPISFHIHIPGISSSPKRNQLLPCLRCCWRKLRYTWLDAQHQSSYQNSLVLILSPMVKLSLWMLSALGQIQQRARLCMNPGTTLMLNTPVFLSLAPMMF